MLTKVLQGIRAPCSSVPLQLTAMPHVRTCFTETRLHVDRKWQINVRFDGPNNDSKDSFGDHNNYNLSVRTEAVVPDAIAISGKSVRVGAVLSVTRAIRGYGQRWTHSAKRFISFVLELPT